MQNEVITCFLNEFTSPSVDFDDESHNIAPDVSRMYLNRIDGMRLDFIQALSGLPQSIQKLYLEELIEKRAAVINRGYTELDSNNLLSFAEWGDGKDGRMMMSLYNLDKGLVKILDKTIAAVRTLTGVIEQQPEIKNPQEESQPLQNRHENYPDVLSGTDGLKNYLGCSHNKAFDIIKSRILPSDVQYMTGRVWKFNRKKLDEFLSKHPEALGKVRQGGVIE